MKAVDTNVLARFFIDDEDDKEAAKQRPAAVKTMSGEVFVSISVILEFEWVMRGFYELARKDILRILESLCGLANVQIQDRGIVLNALSAYAQGLDFADALHLAHADICDAFISFDQRLLKRANAANLTPRVEMPAA